MKIIVCTKIVPSYVTEPKVAEAQDKVNYKTQHSYMNKSDEYALEEAVALKKEYGGDVTMITAGELIAQNILYRGLAKGADESIRIDTDLADTESIAKVLAETIKGMEFDLVLTGVESEDNMAAQVGVFLAEKLGLPFAYAVTKVEVEENRQIIRVNKELGGGIEQVIEISLPALLCIQSGIVPLRYTSVQKILQARSKPVKSLTLSDLGLGREIEKRVRLVALFPPEKKRRAEIIEGKPTEVARLVIEKIKEVV